LPFGGLEAEVAMLKDDGYYGTIVVTRELDANEWYLGKSVL
jgi:hypothetical protein